MHQELIDEGYDDIKIMGINGKQYDYSNDTCMLCDCIDGTCYTERELPWAQDGLDSIYYNFDNEMDCENNQGLDDDELIWHDYDDYCFDPYVWGLWDITIRDFFILDRNGNLVAKINLTYNNPSPSENCGNTYQNIKDLLIQSR